MRHAVILAGGSGTRLWPASRRALPKQLLPLGPGGETLLAATVRRARAVAGQVVIVTAADQAEATRQAVPGVEVIAEPAPRNTALAIGLAAIHLQHRDPDAVLGILPADHHVADEAGLAAVLEQAFTLAEREPVIVTVGIKPSRPETGYGYLELGDPSPELPEVATVARFVEKPDPQTAIGFVKGGRHLWNAGMFFARGTRLVEDINRLLPETAAVLGGIAEALAGGAVTANAAAERLYPKAPSISFDHGVMEHTTGRVTVPADVGWNDVGSWAALRDVRGTDDHGNTLIGDAIVIDADNNIVATDAGTVVALVGVNDLVVVRAGDALVVLPRSRAQEVRRVVDALAERGLTRYL